MNYQWLLPIISLFLSVSFNYRTMITLAIYGGMRMGELAALEWNDIDFEKGNLTINKSLLEYSWPDNFC